MRKLFILLLLASPLFLTGQVCENRCLDFDGINDWVTLSPTPLPANSNFTVEMWFRSSNTNGNTNCSNNFRRLFSIGDNTANRLEFGECGGNLNVYWNTGGVQALGGPNINDNQWRHLAFVRTGTQVQTYIDGVAVSVINSFPISYNPSNFRIGSWQGGFAASAQWLGQMDEVRLWNTARTQQQINDLMHCCITGTMPSGLVTYWKLNDGIPAGNNQPLTTVTDATGGGNDGQLFSFNLMGGFSNFLCASLPSPYNIQVQGPNRNGPISQICNGDPIHLCLLDDAGMPVPSSAGAVLWEELDNIPSWVPVPDFTNFCFVVQPNTIVSACTNPTGKEIKTYRASVTRTAGGTTCEFFPSEFNLDVCCPVDNATVQLSVIPPNALNGTLCEGDVVDIQVNLNSPLPYLNPIGGGIGIKWYLNGSLLGTYDDLTSFTHNVTVGTQDLCFMAEIENCACPVATPSACIPVDPHPQCGEIMGMSPNLTQLVPGPNPEYSICPGNDAAVAMVNPSDFQNCNPVWQYAFNSSGPWTDVGISNPTQNTNILPSYLWPPSATEIFYRIECRPFSNPSGCEPCYSDIVRIELQAEPPVPTINGPSFACKDATYNLNLGFTPPGLTYTWYCNGKEVQSGNSSSLNNILADRSACYWVEVSDGCHTLQSDSLCVTVCEVVPIILCDIDENNCVCEDEVVELDGSQSYSTCSNNLTYQWSVTPFTPANEWSANNLSGYAYIPDFPGGNTITLKVTDDHGCMAQTQLTITPCPHP